MTTSDDTNPDLPAVTAPAPDQFRIEVARILGYCDERGDCHPPDDEVLFAAMLIAKLARDEEHELKARIAAMEARLAAACPRCADGVCSEHQPPLATVERWVAWDGDGGISDVVADRGEAEVEAEYMRADGRQTAKPYLAVVQIYEAATPEAVEKFARGLADLVQRRLTCDPSDRMLANKDEPKGASEE